MAAYLYAAEPYDELTDRQNTSYGVVRSLKERGRMREAATLAYQLFQSLPKNEPYHPCRFCLFSSWIHTFKPFYLEATDADCRKMRVVANDVKEAKAIRCATCSQLQKMYWLRDERDEAAYWLSECIRVGKKAKVMDRSTICVGLSVLEEMEIVLENPSAGQIIDSIVDGMEVLSAVQNPFLPENYRKRKIIRKKIEKDCTSGFISVEARTSLGVEGGILSKKLAFHLLSWGGNKCDTCKRTLKECKMQRFSVCARCKKTYYCSKECQTRGWNDGHKTYCRGPGIFKVGDFVRISGRYPVKDYCSEQIYQIDKKQKSAITRLDLATGNTQFWSLMLPDSTRGLTNIPTRALVQLRPIK